MGTLGWFHIVAYLSMACLLLDLLCLLVEAKQRSFLKVADAIRAQLLCGLVMVLTRHVSDIVHHSLDLETTQCNASLSGIEPPRHISFSWVFHPVSWYSHYLFLTNFYLSVGSCLRWYEWGYCSFWLARRKCLGHENGTMVKRFLSNLIVNWSCCILGTVLGWLLWITRYCIFTNFLCS